MDSVNCQKGLFQGLLGFVVGALRLYRWRDIDLVKQQAQTTDRPAFSKFDE
jgi:hypothetical protein